MMIRKLLWLQIGLLIGTTSITGFADNGRMFRAEEYGKAGEGVSDSTKAIQTAINEAIRAGSGSIVRLEKGRYRVSAEDLQACIKIGHADGLVIQGKGDDTELIVANPRSQAINFSGSRNVIVKSLVIDYDPVPYTQGRIANVNTEEGYFDLDIDEGFSELEQPWFTAASEQNVSFGMIFDGERPVFKINVPDHVFLASWEKLEGRVYRLKTKPDQKSKVVYIDKGDRYVQIARLAGGGAGVYFGNSERCGLEDVKIYAGNSGAVISQSCTELAFRRLEVKRRPDTKRLLSTNADGVHCQQNRTGPLIEDCRFEYIADDTINIYCPVSRILEVLKNDELILSDHCVIQQGDRLQIYNSREGRVLAECTAKVLEQLPDNRYRVQLDKAVEGARAGTDALEADAVFNLSASGEGYVIRNNHIAGQRRYGILARGGKGLIEGNYIDSVRGWGIVLANDPGWPEGPVPSDVAIRNNTIIHPAESFDSHRYDCAAIVVVNMRAGRQIGNGRDVRNIVIEGNKIIDPVSAGIFIGGIKNAALLNNEITASQGVAYYQKSGAVRIVNCEGVRIDGLKVTDPRPDCIAAVEIFADTADGSDGVVISRLKTKLNDSSVEILDNRKE